jgi:hypothetical protein
VAVEYRELPALVSAQDAIRRARRSCTSGRAIGARFRGATGRDRCRARARRVVTLSAYHTRVVGNPSGAARRLGSLRSGSGPYYRHATTRAGADARPVRDAGIAPEIPRGGREAVAVSACAQRLPGMALLPPRQPAAGETGRQPLEVFVADEQARDIVH